MRYYNYNLQVNPKEPLLIYELVLSNIGSGHNNDIINYITNFVSRVYRLAHDTSKVIVKEMNIMYYLLKLIRFRGARCREVG
jgi:hypothetical protein